MSDGGPFSSQRMPSSTRDEVEARSAAVNRLDVNLASTAGERR